MCPDRLFMEHPATPARVYVTTPKKVSFQIVSLKSFRPAMSSNESHIGISRALLTTTSIRPKGGLIAV